VSAEQGDRARHRDPASNEALIEKYAAVAYPTQSNARSHPDRLATLASLHGLSPPPLATSRVLEVGCEGLPRALLVLLDGTREDAALDAALGPAIGLEDSTARRRIDGYVRQFGRLGLLVG